MLSHQIRINQFMRLAGQEVPTIPCIPSPQVRYLRTKLILEEAIETIDALGFVVEVVIRGQRMAPPVIVEHDRGCNIVEVADGCADLSVVNIGTLSAFGIRADEILRAVDLSNLDKFRGDAHRREDGKWIKPSDWVAPDFMKLLQLQGYDNNSQSNGRATSV